MRNDQVFTPIYIVKQMLDKIGYEGENIKYKKILEPSFGSGAFLIQIVDRIFNYAKLNNLSEKETIEILDNVHGVELDKKLYEETKKELKTYCKDVHGILYDFKNLINADSTKIKFNNDYDYVVGNPPYIRVHDLKKEERNYIEKNFQFSQGNTDLYITFFEIGLNAMKEDGKLAYITPNSYMKNSSQKEFRQYLSSNHLVQSIVDYGNVSVFGNISTYTAITFLHKNSYKTEYIKMKERDMIEYKTKIDLSKLKTSFWSIVSEEDNKFLNNNKKKKVKLSHLCEIQYGLATNADNVYLIRPEDAENLEKELLRPIIKASTLEHTKYVIFPYKLNNKTKKFEVIDEKTMKSKYPKTYSYLSLHKDKLLNRDMEKNLLWYQYARSQGIQSANNEKFVIKHIVSGSADKCSVLKCGEETLVYSGMFIVIKDKLYEKIVKDVLESNEFCRYVKLVGKDMSGGYKSFNTKIVKDFGIELEKGENYEIFDL